MDPTLKNGNGLGMSVRNYWAFERRTLIAYAKRAVLGSHKDFGSPGAELELRELRTFLDDYGDYLARHEADFRKLRGLPPLESEFQAIWKNWRRKPADAAQPGKAF